MARIALATSRELPDLWPGDRLLLTELRRRGHVAAPLVWDDGGVRWRDWNAVVIRSCWDYHLKADAFLAWLEAVASEGVPVVNAPDVVRWNLHKGYLLEVARAGSLIPPTRVAPRHDVLTLRQQLERAGWAESVIKPAISASGYSTRLVTGDPSSDDERAYADMIDAGDVLLQARVPEVEERGEWSFVFFDRQYSHGVLKRAAPGEFRVHIEWGGTVESATPAEALVRDAGKLVNGLDLPVPYARVDGTEVDGRLMLMELELIEPELFLDHHPEAASRLASAVLRHLTGRAE
jgi:glutathione synthase/RimK-type ligase-like ATP-grasp enzyme